MLVVGGGERPERLQLLGRVGPPVHPVQGQAVQLPDRGCGRSLLGQPAEDAARVLVAVALVGPRRLHQAALESGRPPGTRDRGQLLRDRGRAATAGRAASPRHRARGRAPDGPSFVGLLPPHLRLPLRRANRRR